MPVFMPRTPEALNLYFGYTAGLLARSLFVRLPNPLYRKSGKVLNAQKVGFEELTAAGAAPDFHRIPLLRHAT